MDANFEFGFEDNKRQRDEYALKSAAAKKNLYEYTKASQENVQQWRHDQITKNRVSNIQWGLKGNSAMSKDIDSGNGNNKIKYSLKAKDSLNQTFTNMN